MERKVNVVEDLNGKKTVFIHDILFKGKRAVNWDEVEKYLRQYVGEFYQIEDCNKMIYIGSDLPDEYTHSNYTRILKGANAKAKANAAQGLPELLKIATNEVYEIIVRRSIVKMLNMVGIHMIQDLLFRYLVMMEK